MSQILESALTDGEIKALIESFPTVGDAFFFVGASTRRQIIERVRGPPPEAPSEAPPEASCKLPEAPPEAPLEDSYKLPEAPPEPPTLKTMPKLTINCSKTIVVFDTETTGLKPAIICQLAFLVIEEGVVVREVDTILKLPEGVRIQKGAQDIHKISNEMCNRLGVDAHEALSEFLCLCRSVLANDGLVVAHNSSFDSRAIKETCEKWDIFCDFENENVFCTMKNSKHFSPLLNKAGHKKQFRNDELYEFFYNQGPDFATLHNAIDDVRVTALNLAAGVNRGLFSVS